MSHLIFILITSVLSITFQGRRIFKLQHSPKHPAASGGRYSHWAKERLHNTSSAIIAYTKRILIDDDADLVYAGTSGMGGMAKGEGEGRWLTQNWIIQILLNMCVALVHSFLILMVWQMA